MTVTLSFAPPNPGPVCRMVRLFNTARYLRPQQIVSRVRRATRRATVDLSPSPARRRTGGTWVAHIHRPRLLLSRWTVRFLNEEGDISAPAGWNDPRKKKLWLYNLHYFDDLNSVATPDHRKLQCELINRWIAENPPGDGNGWEPYPLSIRIVNWIKWALSGEVLPGPWADSLAAQARCLSDSIEWHLLGNHILANAKALVFAGLFFTGEQADRWLRQGLEIIERELPEQILPDGAHFELSPMYHAIILEDFLDLINAARHFSMAAHPVFSALPGKVAQMRSWLAAMTHPDGGLSFFNDAAFGIAPARSELEAYARRLGLSEVQAPGEGAHQLSASGYIRVNHGSMYAILDIASVGPDYIPGHAHADTLSFELGLGDERIVVNGGTSTYAAGLERQAQRGTRAHSTVEIGNTDSSEVWSAFRVARRARVRNVCIEAGRGQTMVDAAHDGYRRLPGKPTHKRTWVLNARSCRIDDAILGGSHPAVAQFHLPPWVSGVSDRATAGLILTRRDASQVTVQTTGAPMLTASRWHPEFGLSLPATSISVPIHGGKLRTRIDWR